MTQDLAGQGAEAERQGGGCAAMWVPFLILQHTRWPWPAHACSWRDLWPTCVHVCVRGPRAPSTECGIPSNNMVERNARGAADAPCRALAPFRKWGPPGQWTQHQRPVNGVGE
eukprot:CAMPEP_0174386810 /NCGR_PEP_ID=MMETSP0811_2-20130205/127535_1 /TAXON_ID=73025 ORGANISM="Eutreptiella gymnastica-like, Strain CCMP1594" /NCGR_SAMPLE_ID=MMETSP0811_2 /ASSEMBLY_ACC=CAM_ASM_000667 /LENGTH=112 /DNA_ID=CAMNT_0015541625 /DNA_START=628 /DNA_END=963 /DNA_ORIENTATION=+